MAAVDRAPYLHANAVKTCMMRGACLYIPNNLHASSSIHDCRQVGERSAIVSEKWMALLMNLVVNSVCGAESGNLKPFLLSCGELQAEQ